MNNKLLSLRMLLVFMLASPVKTLTLTLFGVIKIEGSQKNHENSQSVT